ncbi:MAG: GAF domain-containing protein [Pseudomonadota bacterium]
MRITTLLTGRIQTCADRESLFDLTLDLMRHVTEYDRVSIYKFDQDFNGEVLAERRTSSIESILGLRFPHWDIPSLARDIMKVLPLRLIESADQEQVPLLAASADLAPLNMTRGALRGVSGIHLQYLRSAEFTSTMTLSIVLQDQLWGMISFHHRQPRRPSPRLREILKGFLPIFCTKFLALQQVEMLERVRSMDAAVLETSKKNARIDTMLLTLVQPLFAIMQARGVVAVGEADIIQ